MTALYMTWAACIETENMVRFGAENPLETMKL